MHGLVGNSNACKTITQSAEEIRNNNRLAAQKRRAFMRGDVEEARRLVGRPRKLAVKGDIFDVAAKLARALNALLRILPSQEQYRAQQIALQAYRDYWEKD